VLILARMAYTATTASTAATWSERVRAWRASGETAAAFAEGKGFAGSTLRFWATRLKSAPLPSSPRIVQLVARSAAPTELLVEVGAARVRVGRGFDRELLADVVGALSGAAR
jgi:hypothetical protein